jgi:hypothetical protein
MRIKELSEGDVLKQQGDEAAQGEEAMNAEFGLAMVEMMAGFAIEGISAYTAPCTLEAVQKTRVHWHSMQAHLLKAANASMETSLRCTMLGYWSGAVGFCCRYHSLPSFTPDEACGAGGARLREIIRDYSADVGAVAKQVGARVDVFTYGCVLQLLLYWYGDLPAMGVSKLLDAQRRMLEQVQQGVATAESYAHETAAIACMSAPAAFVAAEAWDSLRAYLANSLFGVALDDEAIRIGIGSYWEGTGFGARIEEDGHCYTSFKTWLLVVRALKALVEDAGVQRESDAALREWLPPSAELLRIAEYEVTWRAQPTGACHPTLLFARLHGERLGDWALVEDIAQGYLGIEEFAASTRVEAYRLLGRAFAQRGQHKAACQAAEKASAEAAQARYVWLEMLSLRDLLEWHEAGLSKVEEQQQALAQLDDDIGLHAHYARLEELVSRVVSPPAAVVAWLTKRKSSVE